MDLIKDPVKKLYFRFLLASFGSALIGSIYGMVDTAMVGQYHGPNGAAAIAVIAPIWNIVYSLGLLAGIGGSVLYAIEQGRGRKSGYFTSAVLLCAVLSALAWAALWVYEEPILRLMGADADLLPLCRQYLTAVRLTVPVYPFTQLLSAFLRNDGAPGLATRSVVFGGIFNVFGDYFFVFVLDLGILGAGIATAMGAIISTLVMLTHFFTKKSTLPWQLSRHFAGQWGKIVVTGFSSFFVDIAMGIVTMLFNRQIKHYLGNDALAVYSVIVSVSTFLQCCCYGIGQAAQPILSQNFGAGRQDRIAQVQRYALLTCAAAGILSTLGCMAGPGVLVRIFMSPTQAVLAIAPAIIRVYALGFLLLPLNVYATYYFQATLHPGLSFTVSVLRGALVSGGLIVLLPLLCGPEALWGAMPVTELAVALLSVAFMLRIRSRNRADAA